MSILDGSNMRRMVPEMQAAERRMWNSKSSEDTSVTKADCEPEEAPAPLLMVSDLFILVNCCLKS